MPDADFVITCRDTCTYSGSDVLSPLCRHAIYIVGSGSSWNFPYGACLASLGLSGGHAHPLLSPFLGCFWSVESNIQDVVLLHLLHLVHRNHGLLFQGWKVLMDVVGPANVRYIWTLMSTYFMIMEHLGGSIY